MVHWAWIPISLMIGVFSGMLIIAFMAVARQEDEKKKWWEE